MVTVSFQDGEGELLKRLRAIVGPDLPIIVSLDMHANVTAAMVELSDAMAIYRTYPHLDMAATGERCVKLMLERLRLGRPFEKAFGKASYLVPLSAQCTNMEPFKSLYASLPALESEAAQAGDLLGIDVASGFPPADIFECGPAVVAYGRHKEPLHRAFDRVFNALLAAESKFSNPLVAPAEAVAIAMRDGRPGRPVVLADVQDNPGCGATSDTTTVIQTLIEAGAQKAAVSTIWDPASASAAHAAGVGSEIELQLGGRYGYDPAPLRRRFRVEALSDGELIGHGDIVGGGTLSLGRMAQLKVLETAADVRIVVGSVRTQCLDQVQFRGLGIEPKEQAILVVKSTVHFRADFDPIAAETIMVEAPGANPCRCAASPYRNLRPGVRLTVGDR
jgi:microcystin degradation protein MlrC